MWILNALAQYFSDLLASTFSTYVYIEVSLQSDILDIIMKCHKEDELLWC